MRKFDKLLKAIDDGNMALIRELSMELYNDVRDLSQSIDVVEDEESKLIITNHKYSSPECVLEKKRQIQKWVGGH